MKPHLPLLLYSVSMGLFGLAGWTVCEMLPLRKDSARLDASDRGQRAAHGCLDRGREQVLGQGTWRYVPVQWWEALKRVNLIGWVPQPPKPAGDAVEDPRTPLVERPLEEIIELVSLVHDGEAKGRGGETHVIVRYRPAADVKPPEWYIRAYMTPSAASSAIAANVKSGPGRRGSQRPPQSSPSGGTSQIPTSMGGREILQKVWVVDDGDPRHGCRLWPTYDNIRLVGVSRDAKVAYFVRDLPPPKEGPSPEPKEEALMMANVHVSEELLQALQGLEGRATRAASSSPVVPGSAWLDLPETKVVNGVHQISKKDHDRLRSPDELLSQIHVDTYAGEKLKGLIVRGIDPQLAATFGIAAGEVLLEINGRAVRSKSEARVIAKQDYERGVRRFVTAWLANGVVVERIYQFPDR